MNITAGIRVAGSGPVEPRARPFELTTAVAEREAPSESSTATTQPTRFPWLSWASRSLDPVGRPGSPFEQAPVLGSSVDTFV